MTDNDNSGILNRRQFVKATAATAAAGFLAGCADVYTSEKVVLPDDAQADLGLNQIVEEQRRTNYNGEVAGREVDTTIESSIALYTEGAVQMNTPNGSDDGGQSNPFKEGNVSVGVISTPPIREVGQTFNPFARLDLGALLTNDRSLQLLNSVSDGQLDVSWRRQPEQLSTTDATMLGESTTMESHAGILESENTETPTLVYLHLARVETDSSVVISAGVQAFDVEDTSRSYVGSNGYITQSELESARSLVADADAALVFE